MRARDPIRFMLLGSLLAGCGEEFHVIGLRAQAAVPFALSGEQIALGDVDGDGRADLVAISSDGLRVRGAVLRGLAEGRFGPGPGFSVEVAGDLLVGAPLLALGVADVSGGAGAEVLVGISARGEAPFTKDRGRLSALALQADGSFAAPVQSADLPYFSGVAAGDLNRDGRRDLLLRTPAARAGELAQLSTALGDGRGGFSAGPPRALAGAPAALLLAELVGEDGRLDLLMVNAPSRAAPQLELYGGAGDGTFSATPTQIITGFGGPAGTPGAVASGDVDGDGRADLLVTSGRSLLVLLARGGRFAVGAPQQSSAEQGADRLRYELTIPPTLVALEDRDGDGRPDVVLVDAAGGQALTLRNASR